MATILLVDDNEGFRHAASCHLDDAGYDVIALATTSEALEALDAGRPIDLAVLDIHMPRGHVHGYALARMARIRRPRLPIVFVTGYPELAAAEGDQGKVLVKPFELRELTDQIKAKLAA
jgi:CheY-like chemotaxis protein